jgi:hypothetical protein
MIGGKYTKYNHKKSAEIRDNSSKWMSSIFQRKFKVNLTQNEKLDGVIV